MENSLNLMKFLTDAGCFLCSLVLIQGAPVEYYSLLGVMLFFDFIFSTLISLRVRENTMKQVFVKIFNITLFLVFIVICFNMFCIFGISQSKWGSWFLKTVALFYLLSITKLAVNYFTGTDVPNSLKSILLLLRNGLDKLTSSQGQKFEFTGKPQGTTMNDMHGQLKPTQGNTENKGVNNDTEQ